MYFMTYVVELFSLANVEISAETKQGIEDFLTGKASYYDFVNEYISCEIQNKFIFKDGKTIKKEKLIVEITVENPYKKNAFWQMKLHSMGNNSTVFVSSNDKQSFGL